MATFTGTPTANHILGTAATDIIRGYGGNDILEGRGGNDKIYGGGGADSFLFASGDGQDVITDLAAGDVMKITGYTSALSLTQAGTSVVLTLSASDKITFSNATLASVQAAIQFGDTSGGGTGGTITGTSGYDTLTGTPGADTIYGLGGYDVIHGGAGNDRIYGGLAGDGLYGGSGADVFVYTLAAEAPPYGLMYTEWDTIYDFQSEDKIDLSAIDANTLLSGNQSFHFAGYISAAEYPPTHSAGDLYIRTSGEYADIIAFTDNDTTPDVFLEVVQGSGQGLPGTTNLIM